MNKLTVGILSLIPAVTFAQDAGVVDAVPSFDHPVTAAQQFYVAAQTGNGWLMAMFILFIGVGALRMMGKRVHELIPDDTKNKFLRVIEIVLGFFFDTKVGGWVLNWLSAIGGCLASAQAAGMAVNGTTWKVAIMASSGGTVLIELKDDVMEWWEKRVAVNKAGAEALAAATPAAAAATPASEVKPSADTPPPPAPTV